MKNEDYTHTHTHAHARTHTHTHAHAHARTHAHTHTNAYTHTHTHKHTHTHTKLHSAFGSSRLKGFSQLQAEEKSNVRMENKRIWLSPAKKGLDGGINVWKFDKVTILSCIGFIDCLL